MGKNMPGVAATVGAAAIVAGAYGLLGLYPALIIAGVFLILWAALTAAAQ